MAGHHPFQWLDDGLEVRNGGGEAIFKRCCGTPAEEFFCPCRVGAALFRVVDGGIEVNNLRRRSGCFQNRFGELQDRSFFLRANIHGIVDITHHETIDAIDGIGVIAKGAGVGSIAVHGERFAAEGLSNEVRHNSAIIQAHSWTVSVKESNNASINPSEAVIGHRHSLAKAFGFVVHGSRTDWVNVSPIRLGLRRERGIPVNLAGGGKNEFCAFDGAKVEAVLGAMRPNSQHFERNSLEIVWGSRGGKVSDKINVPGNLEADRTILFQHTGFWIVMEVGDVFW